MLVLGRRPGEKVVIGNGITVTVVEVRGDRVRLAFEAPDQVRILRAELAGWQEDHSDLPADGGPLGVAFTRGWRRWWAGWAVRCWR
jgi:carbon storage regulator